MYGFMWIPSYFVLPPASLREHIKHFLYIFRPNIKEIVIYVYIYLTSSEIEHPYIFFNYR